MSVRLASGVQVSALIRRIETMGGSGMVLAKGDSEAGAILLLMADRGIPKIFLERILDVTGAYAWHRTGPQNIEVKEDLNLYMQRKRARDPDLWIVELDVAGVERLAAEMISEG